MKKEDENEMYCNKSGSIVAEAIGGIAGICLIGLGLAMDNITNNLCKSGFFYCTASTSATISVVLIIIIGMVLILIVLPKI